MQNRPFVWTNFVRVIHTYAIWFKSGTQTGLLMSRILLVNSIYVCFRGYHCCVWWVHADGKPRNLASFQKVQMKKNRSKFWFINKLSAFRLMLFCSWKNLSPIWSKYTDGLRQIFRNLLSCMQRPWEMWNKQEWTALILCFLIGT